MAASESHWDFVLQGLNDCDAMTTSMRRRAGIVIGLGLLLASCGRVQQSSSKGTSCDAGALHSCDQPACATGEVCDGGANTSTDGGADGGGPNTGPDSGPALCDGGSCQPAMVCQPGAEICVDSALARCNASGSGWLAPIE